MKTIILFTLLVLFAGCQKTVDEKIIDSVKSIQVGRINEFDGHQRKHPPLIAYRKSVRIFMVDIHYFSVSNEPLTGYTVVAIEDSNKGIHIVKNRNDILRYMRPSIKSRLKYGLREDYLTRSSNSILSQVIELLELINEGDVLISSKEDIPDLSESDKKRLANIDIHQLKKSVVNEKLEINFFTWNYLELLLTEHKLILSDRVDWEKKIVLQNFGPAYMYHRRR